MKKLSLPVVGAGVAAVLALGAGGALASGVIGGATQPASDNGVYVAPTSEATPTSAAEAPVVAAVVPEAPSEVPVPVEPPVVQQQPDTVESVTEPTQQPTGGVVDPESIGTIGPDGNYTMAPPRQNPGEPPVLPPETPVPAEKLPGEFGYVPPAN